MQRAEIKIIIKKEERRTALRMGREKRLKIIK